MEQVGPLTQIYILSKQLCIVQCGRAGRQGRPPRRAPPPGTARPRAGPGPQQRREGLPVLSQQHLWGRRSLEVRGRRNGDFATWRPCHTWRGQRTERGVQPASRRSPGTRSEGAALTSVAMTHSSLSSDMTYTDWYLVSLEAEHRESGLFLSDAALLTGKDPQSTRKTRPGRETARRRPPSCPAWTTAPPALFGVLP